MTEQFKLKDVSDPISLRNALNNLYQLAVDSLASEMEVVKQAHITLTGMTKTKMFGDLDDCTLTSGSAVFAEGYLYC